MKNIAVYPGSFDPFTNGHLDIIRRAHPLFEEIIIAVAINSKKTSLFSPEERVEMIGKVFKGWGKIKIDSFEGLTVDYCKEKNSRVILRGLRAVTDFDYEYAISLMNKKLAPEIETYFLMADNEYSFVSSTIVKEVARHGRAVSNQVPDIVGEALTKKFSV
ncbi:pantetheine-phosphate adenylyltransferase [Leptospira terpstrae]|uniref:pantetheine-phosphate adenylyltransferase n=1 Tax=Leptospira terpstrae TaxID=293075 RepID=UPI003CFBE55F